MRGVCAVCAERVADRAVVSQGLCGAPYAALAAAMASLKSSTTQLLRKGPSSRCAPRFPLGRRASSLILRRRPVPLYLSDERPGSISITLNVHFAEDDVTLKVAVWCVAPRYVNSASRCSCSSLMRASCSRCFTVGQAASFALKRLNTIFHKPIADESATYSLAIPVEGGEPTLLSSSLTLKEAHLDDEVRIRIPTRPAPHID